MKSLPVPSPLATLTDAELVAACLGGDRDAFARIVERYQRLLCSLAFAATGNVSESEDAAQEAFIAAWSRLGELREPEKLRPWLCGILRHKVGHRRRRYGRDAVLGAEPVDSALHLVSEETPAVEAAMQGEEQAILWRALEALPPLYREPLVLYYRENRSVEHVAVALDLSEDAVKQRLARGRKLVQERALAFVEGALARTTPGKAFTLGVLAALPAIAPGPTQAAGVGAVAAAQGGLLAKTTTLAALLAAISGVVSTLMQLRTNLDQARTPRERRSVVRLTAACFGGALGFLGLLWGLREVALRTGQFHAALAVVAQVLVVGFVLAWPCVIVALMRYGRRLRSEERRRHPELFQAARDRVGAPEGVYRSRVRLFGVPLIHVRFASPDEGEPPVLGWIAGGDRAIGLVFAWGGWAVAPISVGGFAAGLLAVGAVSVGVVGIGTFGTGLLAIGALAIGAKAFGWMSALGWFSARSDGFAVARHAAEGPVAFAAHANDAVARALLTDPNAPQSQMIFFVVVSVLTLLPMAAYAAAVRRRLGPPGRRVP